MGASVFYFVIFLSLVAGSSYAQTPSIRISNAHIANARLAGTGVPAPDPCAGTPAAGTECTGGAKYVGTFDPLDGNGVKKYMTTPADAGLKVWAPESVDNATARSVTDGLANTIVLEGKGLTYEAGYYCGTLIANGYSDWFLPALNELNLLYLKKGDIGGFATAHYWSSTESNANFVWYENFASSFKGTTNKPNSRLVCCVRRY